MITTIIEKFIASVDQATFQKMMNHLLHLEGNKFLSSPGSVIGKNKTSKGSPDSFFEDGENFIFCEFTTQERLKTGETFYKKLEGDISHCFDKKKTGIEPSKISKVILAFTEELKPLEYSALKSLVASKNPDATLTTYSIQEIPFKLMYYPGLADKYIPGVKTTKGTFYTLPDFLATTERGLQPALTNKFIGRTEDLKLAQDYLLANDLLILTGNQGVGKSKLAIQLAEIFEKDFAFEPRVIVSSPVPLWEDLNNFILPDKKYLIFFDDANKSLPNLDYLIQFISSREPGTTKVILTVRDYVRDDLNKYLQNSHFNEIALTILEDAQLKEIILAALPAGISIDPIVLERILAISKGNSRLALMAVSSILKDSNIDILKNVASLYDKYFQNVKFELSIMDNPDNLKALGILAFFGVLDRKGEIKDILASQFGIDWNKLWETFIELEKSELVDLFSKETAKISDQVLSTYVFYKTFIDEESATINYSQWIATFIDKQPTKINKTLIDVINTFGYTELRDRVITLILEVQKNLEKDKKNLYKFFEIFWFYRETDTLVFIKDWVEKLEEEKIPLEEIKYDYEVNDFVHASEYLKLLINFWNQDTGFTKESIEIGLQLIFKKPSVIPEVLKHLKENFTFHRFDARYGFPRQHALLSALTSSEFSQRETAIAKRILISAAPKYLGWDFHQFAGAGEGKMSVYNFTLGKTEALMELRKMVLTTIFSLFEDHPSIVLEAMNKYLRIGRDFDYSIFNDEQQLISEFFSTSLDHQNYAHCKLVHEYVQRLKKHGIPVSNDWTPFLDSAPIQIAKVFSPKFDFDTLSFEEQEIKGRSKIRTFISGKDISFIEQTLSAVEGIYVNAQKNHDGHQIETHLVYLFQELAETDTAKYYAALELLMVKKYAFDLLYSNIIFYPIRKKLIDIRELYQLLNKHDYIQKQYWKFSFFEAIAKDEIDEFFLNEYVAYLSALGGRLYMYHLEEYIKFDEQFQLQKSQLTPSATSHENVITYIAELLLSKTDSIDLSFDHRVCQNCFSYFSEHVDLLKRIFYLFKKRDHHYDHDGAEMKAISTYEPFFLIEYLTGLAEDIVLPSYRFESLNVGFVWDMPEYEAIIDQALKIIISKAPIWSNFEHQANMLFKDLRREDEYLEKAYQYISRFIQNHNDAKNHIHVILNVVTYSFNTRILRFFREFLLLNNDVEFMQCLWLERNEVTTGSRVPHVESHITFIKSVIELIRSLPNPLNYAEHIKYFENELEYAKKEKIRELKQDFTGYFV